MGAQTPEYRVEHQRRKDEFYGNEAHGNICGQLSRIGQSKVLEWKVVRISSKVAFTSLRITPPQKLFRRYEV